MIYSTAWNMPPQYVVGGDKGPNSCANKLGAAINEMCSSVHGCDAWSKGKMIKVDHCKRTEVPHTEKPEDGAIHLNVSFESVGGNLEAKTHNSIEACREYLSLYGKGRVLGCSQYNYPRGEQFLGPTGIFVRDMFFEGE